MSKLTKNQKVVVAKYDSAKEYKLSEACALVKEITFTQNMSLQGGEYLLSLGTTGDEGHKYEVYHRLYDVLNITVISDKNTVGY